MDRCDKYLPLSLIGKQSHLKIAESINEILYLVVKCNDTCTIGYRSPSSFVFYFALVAKKYLNCGNFNYL